jgi:hypothetical protein
LAAACGSGTPAHYVDTKSYGRTCTTVADCFAVYEGPVGCCGGGCPNTAIRADLLPKYMSAFDEAMKCSVQPPCPPPDPSLCVGRLSCDNGVCQLEQRTDAGSGD